MQSGDQVEILTSKSQRVQPQWEVFATTARARAKIAAILRKERKANQKIGEEILSEFLKKEEVRPEEAVIEKLRKLHNAKNEEELLAAIGSKAIVLGEADKNELKEKLFVEVKQLLEDYMTTSAYQQLLIKQIKNIQKEAGSGKLILYIDPADSDKRSSLQVATGAPVTVSEYSFMGGTRAVLQDRNILIDNSFASKLEKLKADFSFNGGATNA